jgi:hypothetical protein
MPAPAATPAASPLRERSLTALANSSEGFQVLDEILLLQLEPECALVVVDNFVQVLKLAVMIKTALGMGEQTPQGCRAIAPIGRTIRLEIIDADLLGRVHAPTWFGEERRHMAGGAFAGTIEHLLPTLSRLGIEASLLRLRRGHGELVEVESGELGGDQIVFGLHMAEFGLGGHRELILVVQPRIEKASLPMHLEIGDERIPVLFDTTGRTREIWYYEQPRPEGRRKYSKTAPLGYEEFADCLAWWKDREQGERAWKIGAAELIERDEQGRVIACNLDIKNPHSGEVEDHRKPTEIAERTILALMEEIKAELAGLETL